MKDLHDQLIRTMDKLITLEPDTEEYNICLRNQQQLFDTIDNRRALPGTVIEKSLRKFVDTPALVALFGNVAITLLILNYEKLDVVTSRAFAFIRPK